MTTFTELGVPAELIAVLDRQGKAEAFPIQVATIVEGLAGRDLCGKAPTGSGKTLAFSIPIAARTERAKPRRPRALVLVPTRELATQVAEVLTPLARARGRSVATFFGGTGLGRDRQNLQRGIDVAVACPGRLADLVRRGDCDLRDVDLVVLDEADRMADMGFLPEVKRLLDRTSPTRQTLLFSATLDGDVDVLVRRYQKNPVTHTVEVPAEARGDVAHHFWKSAPNDRVGIASDIVRTTGSTIVFTRTKHGADRVARQMGNAGVRAAAIHGNRSQGQRQRALADFAAGRVDALVATDIAARGIHVDQVATVLHFDPPTTDKDYVHRSGRTGRAGHDGTVITLVIPAVEQDVIGLQRKLSLPRGIHRADVDLLPGNGATRQPRVAAAVDHATARPAPRGQGDNGRNGGGRNQPNRNSRRGRRGGGGGGGRRRAPQGSRA